MNMRLELSSTGLAEPRSESGPHQLACQSLGWNELVAVKVGLNLTTASLRTAVEQFFALPVEKKMLWETSSTTTPPPAQMPSPNDGVWKTIVVPPAVGTAITQP